METYSTIADVPVLDVKFPRPVECMHQIEVTSICDLRCVYCTSPHLQRPKMHMTRRHFERAMEHVRHYAEFGTQKTLNLAGIGESTLHPEFPYFMDMARAAVGLKASICFSTNGLTIAKNDAVSRAILDSATRNLVGIFVSLHRPEKAGPAIELINARGILVGISSDPATNADDWAGQVKWHRSQPYVSACQWQREAKAMAMADGRVTMCCLDASGGGTIGHVDDPIGSLKTKPNKLCLGCAQEIGVKGFEQRKADSYA